MQTIIKKSSKNYLLDITNKRITMLDARFYFTGSGSYVPSVTTILDAYPKDAGFYEWLKKSGDNADTLRDNAGKRGSTVHDLTERYDNGEEISLLTENGDLAFSMNEWSMFERYIDFRTRFSLEIIHNEITLISEDLGYAGTLDRVVEMNGKRYLLDIKTSNAIYDSYWLQLAAYENLIKHTIGMNPVDDVAILWLNAKTKTNGTKGAIQGIGWQMVIRGEEGNKDLQLFNATRELWSAQNGAIQPKQLSYQLTHKL